MKNKRTILIAIAMGLLGLMIIISLGKKENKEEIKKEGGKLPEIIVKRLPISFDLPQPEKIEWKVNREIGTSEMDDLTMEAVRVDEKKINDLVKLVGLSEKQKTNDGEEMINFDDGGRKSAYFEKKSDRFSYTETITARKQIEGTGKGAGEIIEMIRKILGLTGTEIKIVSREYKKIVNPRWVTAEEKTAEAIEIRADYFWGEHPIFGFTGEPIVILMSLKGKILKLEVEIIGKLTPTGKIRIPTKNDLAGIGPEETWVWRSEEMGGENENEKVGGVTITMAEVGYIYNTAGEIGEYLIGKGNGVKGSLPVKMTIITPIEK